MTIGLVVQKCPTSNIETGSLAKGSWGNLENYKPSFAGGLPYSLLTTRIWLRNHVEITPNSPQPSVECKLLHRPASHSGSLKLCLIPKFTFLVAEYISLSTRITCPFWFHYIVPGHQCSLVPSPPKNNTISWKCNCFLCDIVPQDSISRVEGSFPGISNESGL